jgi:hypothetical protein
MYKVIGEKCMYLTYCVHLVGIKEVTDGKSAWSAKLQNMQHNWALGPFPDQQALVLCTSFLPQLPPTKKKERKKERKKKKSISKLISL